MSEYAAKNGGLSVKAKPSFLDQFSLTEPAGLPEHGFDATWRSALLRDLENLLNTRVRFQQNMDNYSELPRSLLTYGLPDFSHLRFEMESHRQVFAEQVKLALLRFEPRLREVEVSVLPVERAFERTLYLRISARLSVNPVDTTLLVETQVHSLDRGVQLRELPYG
jgi:type VI secretion system protein ImpF